jgi:threonine dehydratase
MELQLFIEARKRISPYIKTTRVVKSDALEKFLGYQSPIYLKLDSDQPTGSFKVRGAFNVLCQAPKQVENVVAFSSGNFAQAVAYAAAKLGKKATLVMPKNAPQTKIEGTKRWGAEIIFSGEKHEDGERMVEGLAEKQGYFTLHPFNNYQTIAGGGTAALEVLESNPHLAHFFCPVGGGGLLSGCASVLKGSNAAIKTYAVEPLGASDFYESFKTKKHCSFEKTDTIADALRAVSVGKLNFPILMATVDQAIAIPDESIIEAMRLLWQHHELIIEPSGATALAGFLSIYKDLKGEVVILITGKNVDLEPFKNWIGKK